MTRLLVLAIIGLAVLSAAGPMLVALFQAAVPLVIAVGAVALLLRAVWFFTHRW
jgi:hypothetical protein